MVPHHGPFEMRFWFMTSASKNNDCQMMRGPAVGRRKSLLLPWEPLSHFPPTRPLSPGWERQAASPSSAFPGVRRELPQWQLDAPGLRAQVRGTRGRSWPVACGPGSRGTWDRPWPLGCSESYFPPAFFEIFEIVIGAFAVQNDDMPPGSRLCVPHPNSF